LDVGLAAGTSPTIFDFLAIASLSLPAIAVGVAILRYRLFEIDRLISRGVSWALLSGLLVAVYAGAVLLLEGVLGGATQGETVAVAGSTLLAVALFQPLRRRVQSVVDRRFNRAPVRRRANGFGLRRTPPRSGRSRLAQRGDRRCRGRRAPPEQDRRLASSAHARRSPPDDPVTIPGRHASMEYGGHPAWLAASYRR